MTDPLHKPSSPHAPARRPARRTWSAAVAATVVLSGVALALAVPSQAAGTPLQPIVDAASAGDVVTLAPGSYGGPVTVDKPLTLSATPGTVTLHTPGGGWNLEVVADGVTIEGVTLTGFTTDGLLAAGVSDLTVRDVTVTGQAGNGLELRDVTGLTLERVHAHGLGNTGVRVVNGAGVSVNELTVNDTLRGFHLLGGSELTITNASVDESSEHGIVIEGTSGATVTNPRVGRAIHGIWVLWSDDVHVTNPHITGTPDSAFGMLFQDAISSSVRGGTFQNVGNTSANIGNAIESRFSTGLSIEDITIATAGSNGIRLASTHHTTVRNVTMTDVLRGSHLFDTSHVTYDNIHVGPTEEHGIVPEHTHNLTMNAVTIESSAFGIWSNFLTDSSFTDLTILEGRARGVLAFDSHNVTHTRTTLGHGTAVTGDTGFEAQRFDGLTITASSAARLGGNGFVFTDGTDLTFVDNTAHDLLRAVHLVNVTGGLVDGNNVSQTRSDGYVVEQGRNVTVSHNEARDVALGVWFRGHANEEGLLGEGNTIRGARAAGLGLDNGATTVVYRDNDVRQSARGASINGILGGGLPVQGNRYENNTFVDNGHGVHVRGTVGSNTFTGGQIEDSWFCDVLFYGPHGSSVELSGVDVGPQMTANETVNLTLTGMSPELIPCNVPTIDHKPITIFATEGEELNETIWVSTIGNVVYGRAPMSINVTFSNNVTANVPLDEVVDGTAYYRFSGHLDQNVTTASTEIDPDWDSTFLVHSGPTGPPPVSRLWGITEGGDLWYRDLDTPGVHLEGAVAIGENVKPGALAADEDGNLWFTHDAKGTSHLYRIDAADLDGASNTAVPATLVGDTGLGGTSAVTGLDFGPHGLVATGHKDATLHTLDTTTGAAATLATLVLPGNLQAGGLAWTEAGYVVANAKGAVGETYLVTDLGSGTVTESGLATGPTETHGYEHHDGTNYLADHRDWWQETEGDVTPLDDLHEHTRGFALAPTP